MMREKIQVIMTAVSLQWITPDADQRIGYMARVSNPTALPDDPADKLIAYLIKHKHWSPFEMANACVEIITTRDIARQILRHRSFHFQEFSQRYSEAPEEPIFSEARLQDKKNRQNSIKVEDEELRLAWHLLQEASWSNDYDRYKEALKLGVAKELARKLLPEGLTITKMYMNGTIRDWIHYLSIRTAVETQREHREVANQVLAVLEGACPVVFQAARQAGIIEPAKADG
jgi:thymidylate synthase (FAD)